MISIIGVQRFNFFLREIQFIYSEKTNAYNLLSIIFNIKINAMFIADAL